MSPPPVPSGPIFLAGLDRSGIGLLGEILECHPDVSMTRRTNFWSTWAGAFGDLGDPANLERCLAAMSQDRRMRVFEPDADALQARIGSRPFSDADLFAVLQEELMERRGRTRWGDKSLGAERHADTIMAAYPDALMVHVIRDPRDRFASQRRHRGPVRGGAGAGAALWRWSEALAIRHSSRHGDRYTVVRYEDLVREPDDVLADLSGFLGLREGIRPDGTAAAASPLHTQSIGRHREDLTDDERRYTELALRRPMRRQGYEPEPSPASRSDSLAFWFGALPRSLGRDLGWRVHDRLGHHRQRGPQGRRGVAE